MKYVQGGASVYLLVLTDGSFGGDPEKRKAEQQESARIIGAKDVFWGNYEDTIITPLDNILIDRIEHFMSKVKPDFIFVNCPKDTHQDHRNLANAVISATRYTKNVLFYEVPTSVDFTPSVFVDISDIFEDKVKCLKAHASQVNKTHIKGLSILDMAKASANFRGTQGRIKFAEGFYPLRLFIDI
jgi:LmbE family N-acetylglucosaminyl deacetylase